MSINQTCILIKISLLDLGEKHAWPKLTKHGTQKGGDGKLFFLGAIWRKRIVGGMNAYMLNWS